MSEACMYLDGQIVYVPEFEEMDFEMFPKVELTEALY